ncbi:hypothetical protein J2T41_000432 [Pseudomonas citronellolis]|uniref:RNA-directed DNA polymerase n=1 Tax=Pseudomonas citronellolis TaxID=53408 RepID=UPI0020A0F665|nr:RNA-directed DNA polymerase [Pseudomonas citronellolis]MCP1640838.1 hypothetical protein [Pseudomonas citronellolis]MCP1663756.1 hypothetical protein [Pseudomonas citronellolis]MCP1696934.1 hypothetical protein [Pseudomonas citronellolis]MCP1701432.1 hypothetical protein [Pseudomonas citronellolis]MCP1795543.1 hypothetical protein [Pseudomonas citronellolis]
MGNFTHHFKNALNNIIKNGDTDIFPYPIDNIFFYEKNDIAASLLEEIHKDFDNQIIKNPIQQSRALQAVGYYGYRWGTQIDPIWNCYFLALVLSIANDIEKARIETSKNIVFSYRFKLDKETGKLFDNAYNWKSYSEASIEKSERSKYVLKCDISDFYPRVYHHRIENALQKATNNTSVVQRIMVILGKLSKGASYGLPVGGPASRILSELLLNRVDKLLIMEGISFCRYADDYLIFADSEEDAYGSLITLSEKLHENEGLSIQKTKTQIMTSEEFRATSEFAPKTNETHQKSDQQELDFLKLKLFYDPYSPTANDDYDSLKEELGKFDIIGMLGSEINKNRINQALTRRLISSVRHLSDTLLQTAVISLIENLQVLYPVFPSVMILIKSTLDRLSDETKDFVFKNLRLLISSNSYITRIPVNLGYSLRVLAYDTSDEADALLGKIFKEQENIAIKRDTILAMAQRNADYWISDRIKHYNSMTPWEQHSLLLGSFILGDEGSHWRDKVKKELNSYEKAQLDWFSERFQKNKGWGKLL